MKLLKFLFLYNLFFGSEDESDDELEDENQDESNDWLSFYLFYKLFGHSNDDD